METALQNLNKIKSTDWDGIPPKALKVAANETERPLTILNITCIAESEGSTTWNKCLRRIPLEKENYRSITAQVAL